MVSNFFSKPAKQFFLLLGLLAVLPIMVLAAQAAIRFFTRANTEPANIIVDFNSDLGVMPKIWQSFAQGSEEKGSMLASVISDTRNLSPQFIRIDHIFDQYNVVKKDAAGSVSYDFSELDKSVDDILKTGALPFFSLSYMPSDFSKDGVTGIPNNWGEWKNLVRATVGHYSGKLPGQKNLEGVYYEVWNEPDLFGKWKTYGSKNYLDLYNSSVRGAREAENVNNFKIGGPATTGMYQSWIKDLLSYCRENNLRIDFVSYHRYTLDISVFSQDYQKLQEILNNFPEYTNLPIIISEWGSDAENSPKHDANFDAIHTVAAIRQMLDRIQYAFSFEIKDGPGEKEFWGRWGLITHDKFGLHKKPKYYAYKLLNNISGQRVKVDGEGGYVTAFGAKDKENLKLILVNYDLSNTHNENVPVQINNLQNSNYLIKTTFLFGNSKEEFLTINNQTLNKVYTLPPQSVLLLELTKLSPSYQYSLGYFGAPGNWGIYLSDQSLPLSFTREQLSLPEEGTIEFLIKPLWPQDETTERTIFYIPLTEGKTLSLKKRVSGFNKQLEFGVYKDFQPAFSVSSPITNWGRGSWHHLSLSWNKNGLTLIADGKEPQKISSETNFGLFGTLTFNNFIGVIDELRILNKSIESIVVPVMPYDLDSNTILLRHFDRDFEK